MTRMTGRGFHRPLSAMAGTAVAALGVLLLSAGPASATHNDDRSGAVGVSSGTSLSDQDNIDATQQGGEFLGPCPDALPEPDYYHGATVWYEFTAPANGTLRLDAVAFASIFAGFFDPTLAVFDGASISTPITCNDDYSPNPGYDSRLEIRVTAGGTYGIQVGGRHYGGVPDEGFFQLLVNFSADPPPPPPALLEADLKPRFAVYDDRPEVKILKLRLVTEPGATVDLNCRGDCAGIKKATDDARTLPEGELDLKALFGKNKFLDPRTRVELTVTKAGEIGRYFKLKTRAGQSPKAKECRVQQSGELTDCRSE